MEMISKPKLKMHYAWWEDDNKKLFDEIIELQPSIDITASLRTLCDIDDVSELKKGLISLIDRIESL